jgi:hypothetical protein
VALVDRRPVLLDRPLFDTPFTPSLPAAHLPLHGVSSADPSFPSMGRLGLSPTLLASPRGDHLAVHWPFSGVFQVVRVRVRAGLWAGIRAFV